MTDIQSASSVSVKSHFLLGGSAQLRRQLPRRQPTVLMSFLAVVFVGV